MPEKTLPLGTTVEFRGMRGREENLLTNDAKMRSGDGIEELLTNCTLRLAVPGKPEKTNILVSDIASLMEPERKAFLIAIRRESYGDEMRVELRCPSCKVEFAVNVDLSLLPEKPAPEGERPFTTTVDVDGTTAAVVKFDYLDGRREKELAKTKVDVMTTALLLRIREVEGTPRNKQAAWLQDLPVLALKKLREDIQKTECGIDTKRTADCGCGMEVEFDVMHQPGFFFPQE